MSKSILIPSSHDIKRVWEQLPGCSLALALAEFCENTPGIKLIITEDHQTADQLMAELAFFLPEKSQQELMLFPDWETLPYDQFSPHQDLISERLSTLSRLPQSPQAIVLAATSTLMHRLCPPSFLTKHGLVLEENQDLDLHAFRERLQEAGYQLVNKVLEHGEFALRGSIIDLYPMGSRLPFRIELFDCQIDSLRSFDPETQRTIEKLKSIQILPAHECPLNEESISRFRRKFREQFSGNPSQSPIYEAVSQGQFLNGIDYYLPLFFEETATFFDYLPEKSTVMYIGHLLEKAQQFTQEINTRYEQRRHDLTRPPLSPEQCFLTADELLAKANQYQPWRVRQQSSERQSGIVHFKVEEAPPLHIERHTAEPLARLSHFIQQKNHRSLLVVESAGRREVLLQLLKPSALDIKTQASWSSFLEDNAPFNICIGPLSQGAELPEAKISIIVEAQLFGEQPIVQRRSQQKSIDPNLIIRDMAELQIGSPVVHLQFGVGRYQGLETIDNQGMANEFLILAYAGSDKIYVPVTSLNLISRYTGSDAEHAPLHRLGSDEWQKEKKKAAEKIHDIAIELLDTYAKREAQVGHSYTLQEDDYQRFASGFPFVETVDQTQAIQDIIKDLQSSRPMDRLICGDVGFGKTEVAMRAAFIAVMNGKQVCVLVPTTLLAAQHFDTFRNRFADFPVHIELLSRFRSAKESSQVVDSLGTGRTDIIIGTHKLFQKNIVFQRLGLLIIDEEHRFGVKQKEHIKSLRTQVDILSMTATPIPRTLNMAMAGIRDISLIATPPAKRLAIKTFWQEKKDALIREAILREIMRGGQVYYLHNKVQSIQAVAEHLQKLIPEAKMQIAHGQLRERELERIMSDFYHHRFNVLVCSTIIETGIDIPTANTILIDEAHHFGLAQMHQLRGRVGRSHHQAYAYLLTPDKKLLTPDAIKRLDAIVSLEDLGAGFTLATHDLEIRGAGELLGEGQSGNMHAIGFNLFMELLDKAVHDLKAGKIPELQGPMHQGPEINLRMSAIIPESYIGDTHNRLILYKRIANTKNNESRHELQVEMIDRFGLLPPSVKTLFSITELKNIAEKMGITRIQVTEQQGKIEFNEQPEINTHKLILLLQLQSKRYQMEGPNRLKFILHAEAAEEKIVEIKALLNHIANTAAV
jgi:transcription-repair coupling factor (superfamily II helicase)